MTAVDPRLPMNFVDWCAARKAAALERRRRHTPDVSSVLTDLQAHLWYGADNWLTFKGTRRVWSPDRLPMPRALFHGPKWRRRCDVYLLGSVTPKLVFSFEDEVRERVLEQLRPGVFAMWSDPFEQLGITVRRSA